MFVIIREQVFSINLLKFLLPLILFKDPIFVDLYEGERKNTLRQFYLSSFFSTQPSLSSPYSSSRVVSCANVVPRSTLCTYRPACLTSYPISIYPRVRDKHGFLSYGFRYVPSRALSFSYLVPILARGLTKFEFLLNN